MTDGVKFNGQAAVAARPEPGKHGRKAGNQSNGFVDVLRFGKMARAQQDKTSLARTEIDIARWSRMADRMDAAMPDGEVRKLLDSDTARLDPQSVLEPEHDAENRESDDVDSKDSGKTGLEAVLDALVMKEAAPLPAAPQRIALSVIDQKMAAEEADQRATGEAAGDIFETGGMVERAAPDRARQETTMATGQTPTQPAKEGTGSAQRVSQERAPEQPAQVAAPDRIEAKPVTAPVQTRDTSAPAAPAMVEPDAAKPASASAASTGIVTDRAVVAPEGAGSPGTSTQRDDAPRGETISGKVTIVSGQTIPAPQTAPLSTSAALVANLAGDAGWHAAMQDVALAQRPLTQTGAAPVHTLKLQLHPAELGMVTASLKFVGEQLSIDLQVGNAEAYHRLNSDADAIVKSLRAMGFEVDQITVLQPQIATQSNARADTNAGSQNAPSSFQRDAQSFAQGNQGGGGERLGGQAGGQGRGNNGERREAGNPVLQDRDQRGIVI